MLNAFKSVLVLAPHTDDGELGCGGTIVKLIEEGKQVYYAAFSTARQSLPSGFPDNALKVEVSLATAELGIPSDHLFIYDYEVRKLNYNRQELLENLIELKRNLAPDLVLMPSVHDIHQDHSTVAVEGLRAFKGSTVLGYELIWNNLTFNTECFVKLERRHVDSKIRALSAYGSQRGKSYVSQEFLLSLARTRGVQIGASFAECFEVVRLVL